MNPWLDLAWFLVLGAIILAAFGFTVWAVTVIIIARSFRRAMHKEDRR